MISAKRIFAGSGPFSPLDRDPSAGHLDRPTITERNDDGRRAGVSTELHLHPAVPHAFETVAYGTAVARRMTTDRIRVLKAL
jgi:hypothetical protein